MVELERGGIRRVAAVDTTTPGHRDEVGFRASAAPLLIPIGLRIAFLPAMLEKSIALECAGRRP